MNENVKSEVLDFMLVSRAFRSELDGCRTHDFFLRLNGIFSVEHSIRTLPLSFQRRDKGSFGLDEREGGEEGRPTDQLSKVAVRPGKVPIQGQTSSLPFSLNEKSGVRFSASSLRNV